MISITILEFSLMLSGYSQDGYTQSSYLHTKAV